MRFVGTHHGDRADGPKTPDVQLAMNSRRIICKKKKLMYHMYRKVRYL